MSSTDEQLYSKVDYSLLRRLIAYLRPYRFKVTFALLLTFISAALAPLRPFLSTKAVDGYIHTNDAQGLLWIVFAIAVVLIVNAAIQFSLTLLMQWVGQSVLYDIRTKLYAHIQTLSLRYYDTNPVGKLVTRVTNDVEALNELFSSGLVLMISDILMLIGIVVYMFLTSWQLTIITLLVLPFLFGATVIFRKKVRIVYSEIRKQIARMNTFLNESISGIITIQLLGKEKQQLEQFDGINQLHTQYQVRSVFYYALFFPVVELLSTTALAMVLWYTAGHLITGEVTVGMLVAFIQFSEMFFRPIRDLTEKYNTLQSAMAASERIFGLLDTKAHVENHDNEKPLPNFRQSIDFKNVNFAYDGITPILKNVSFTVQKGESVAIVGATGAGKSSIINLITRFYEFQGGQITIDDIDIRAIPTNQLRQHIAIVLQDAFLFSRSIADNIAMGNDDVTHEKIHAIAKAIGAADFIEQLPNKYDTVLMERASNISSGQKQLLAFCRALAADPAILILDEATSHIDTETEQLIEKSIETMLHGRTSIIIAHRLSTIQRADRILVMHQGELREQGTHQELLALGGIYAKLYRLQYQEIKGHS